MIAFAAIAVFFAQENSSAKAETAGRVLPPTGALYDGLDDGDIPLAATAVQQALETQPSASSQAWANEDSGNAGVVTPLVTFKTTTGYYCRRFRETVLSRRNGKASEIRTACRDDDGVWQHVEF